MKFELRKCGDKNTVDRYNLTTTVYRQKLKRMNIRGDEVASIIISIINNDIADRIDRRHRRVSPVKTK